MIIRFGTRLIQEDQIHTYISSTIKVLKSMGVNSGSRVALYDTNTVEYAVLVLCFWRMGIIACPINPHLPLPQAKAYAQKISALFFFKREDIKKIVAFDSRLQLSAAEKWPPFDPSQEAVIVATSGSNGEPKAALLTIGNLMANAKGARAVIPFESNDGWLLSLPLYHVSGLSIVARCLEADSTLIIAGSDSLSDDIKRPGVTHVSLVPTQMYRLLNKPEDIAILKKLKAILIGGSAISQTLLERALNHALPVFITYGLTETASQVATVRVVHAEKPWAHILPGRDVVLSSEGEVLVKGDVVFKGYILGQKIHRPVDDQGYFHTGDLGEINTEGHLRIKGRRDNMFICAGENIHPEEIERVLLTLPGIKQAIVVPQSNPEYGQVPVAFCEMDKEENIVKLRDECRRSLPALKVPQFFYPWPTLAQGLKPSRKILTALAGTLQAK